MRHASKLTQDAITRQAARDAIGRTAPATPPAQGLPADDATKKQLIAWLAARGIAAGPRMSKPQLWHKVEEA